MVKNQPASVADTSDTGSISGLRRSPGVGNGNPLQYSCLENPMDRGAWQATVHGITRSQRRLSTHISVTVIIISSVSGVILHRVIKGTFFNEISEEVDILREK